MKILPFVAASMDPEGITLSGERQTLCDATYTLNFKKTNSQILRTDRWLPEVGGAVRVDEGSRKELPGMREVSPGDVMYNVVTAVNNTVLYI